VKKLLLIITSLLLVSCTARIDQQAKRDFNSYNKHIYSYSSKSKLNNKISSQKNNSDNEKKYLQNTLKKDISKEFHLDSKEEISKEVLEINEKLFIQQPIKIVITDKVKKFIKLYSYGNGRWLRTAFKRAYRWLPYIRQIFREYGLPDELVYLSLIESHFNFNARSRAGAVGLWQFMSSTARKYGLKINWWIDERKDPLKSTEAAAKYLKDLYNMFGSYDLALAAYNAGEGKISRLIQRTKKKSYWHLCKKRKLKKETIAYVPSFYAVLYLIRNNKQLQYIPEEYLNYSKKTLTFVQIPKPYSLFKIAKFLKVKVNYLKQFNPELRRYCTPPYYENYVLKLPSKFENEILALVKDINENYHFKFKVYRVRRGDTLIKIARRYGIYPVSMLKSFNNIRNVRRLRVGQKILLPFPEEYKLRRVRHRYIARKTIKYKVKKGDTLWKVAQKFNVSVHYLKKINKLRNKIIYPGDILIIKKRH